MSLWRDSNMPPVSAVSFPWGAVFCACWDEFLECSLAALLPRFSSKDSSMSLKSVSDSTRDCFDIVYEAAMLPPFGCFWTFLPTIWSIILTESLIWLMRLYFLSFSFLSYSIVQLRLTKSFLPCSTKPKLSSASLAEGSTWALMHSDYIVPANSRGWRMIGAAFASSSCCL